MCVIIFDSVYIPTTKDHSFFIVIESEKVSSVNGLKAKYWASLVFMFFLVKIRKPRLDVSVIQ